MIRLVKNLSFSAGDACLILGLGKSSEEEIIIHSSILPQKIPQTESLADHSPGGRRKCQDSTE